jgi:hypothetical protein
MKRAIQLSEIHQVCTARPLSREQLDEFFVQTADARDPVSSRRDELKTRLQDLPDNHVKQLLAGHRGCGKSTELVKLSDDLDGVFLTVAFSVEMECNIADLAVEDVLVVLMERIIDACNKAGLGDDIANSGETLEEIHDWFSTELKIDESTTESAASAEAGVDVGRTFWGKLVGLLAKAKTSIQFGDKHFHRKTADKPNRISELVNRCNDLIAAVRAIASNPSLFPAFSAIDS